MRRHLRTPSIGTRIRSDPTRSFRVLHDLRQRRCVSRRGLRVENTHPFGEDRFDLSPGDLRQRKLAGHRAARKHGRADATTRRPVGPLGLRLCPRLEKVEVARRPQRSRRCAHRQLTAVDRDPESRERHLCLFPRSAHCPRVAATPPGDRVRLALDSYEPSVRPESRDGPRPSRPVRGPRARGTAGRPNLRGPCVVDFDQTAELGERPFGLVASSLHGPGNPATRFIAPAWQLDIDAPDAVTNQLQSTDTSAQRSLLGPRHSPHTLRELAEVYCLRLIAGPVSMW